MSEDTIYSTRRLDPDEEPEGVEEDAPVDEVTPPPEPMTDAVEPPPLPDEADEAEPAEDVVIEMPTAVVSPSTLVAPAAEPTVVPSPFDAAEEPGVVKPTPVEVQPAPQPDAAPARPPKKDNTVLIIVIVVAVLLLLCCCCIILVAAIGGPLEDVMWELQNMWLGGGRLPSLR